MRPARPALLIVAALSLSACPKKTDGAPATEKGRESRRPASDAAPRPSGPAIAIRAISFAGPAGHRADATFSRGESVICLFSIAGFTYRDRRAEIRADVKVLGIDRTTMLVERDLKLLTGKAPTLRPGQIRSATTLALSVATPPGRYTVEITVRDLLGGRRGQGRGAFTLLGTPPSRQTTFTAFEPRLVADRRVPAGAVVPIAISLRGFKTRREGEGHRVDVGITAELIDPKTNDRSARHEGTLLRRKTLFDPVAFPVEYGFVVPGAATPGPHVIALRLHDRVGGAKAAVKIPVEVVGAESIGVFNAHIHDAGKLSRRSFRFGEQVFVRFSILGFLRRAGRARFAADLAIAGPDGGVYLARKDLVKLDERASAAVANRGRFATQIPLILPKVAPAGIYRLVIRARDLLAKRQTTRALKFRLQGQAPKPLKTFRIDRLVVRLRPDLPPIKGDAFYEGKRYHLELSVGGAKLRKRGRLTYAAKISAHLRLRDMRGKVVQEKKGLFSFARTLHYRPLRILLPASWRVPAGIEPGLYDLQIEAINELDERASQLSKRVAVLSSGRVARVKLPN